MRAVRVLLPILTTLVLVWGASAPGAGEEPRPEPVERAKAAYQAREYGRAITELEAALVHASAYSDGELAEIHLYLGLCYLAYGRAERAGSAFEEALRLDPGLEIDPAERTPEVEEAFQRARWESEEERIARTEEIYEPLGEAIEIPDARTDRTRWGGVWRSCLVPGWGQIYGGRTLRGYAFLAGEVLSLLGAAYATLERDDARDAYEDVRDTSDFGRAGDLLSDYDSWKKTRRTLLIVAGGLWALNILESVLNDPSVAPEMRAMDDWRFGGVAVRPDGWTAYVRHRF